MVLSTSFLGFKQYEVWMYVHPLAEVWYCSVITNPWLYIISGCHLMIIGVTDLQRRQWAKWCYSVDTGQISYHVCCWVFLCQSVRWKSLGYMIGIYSIYSLQTFVKHPLNSSKGEIIKTWVLLEELMEDRDCRSDDEAILQKNSAYLSYYI